MISMFKKYWSRLKNKVCPALLSICLISYIVSPFASAADFTGQGSVSVSLVNGQYEYVQDRVMDENMPYNDRNGTLTTVAGGSQGIRLNYARIGTTETVFTSPVTLYLSMFAWSNDELTSSIITPKTVSYDFSYYDANNGVQIFDPGVEVSYFTPNFDALYVSWDGISLKGTFPATVDNPIFYPAFVEHFQGVTDRPWSFRFASGVNTVGGLVNVRVVSFRAVTTESMAELEGLENIADSIVAQSEILSAFYGDIVAVCNQIYSRLGDMQETAELANQYFQQMITLLQHIDTVSVNIYNLLPTQFALLETAINTASVDIASAISAQTNALITYFDSVFSGAVGDLPEQSEDLDSQIGNVGTAENEYKSNASATFEQLSTEFTGFTGGTLSGIALASNLFTQVWNALGEYSVVYSFPLLLGLSLLLIGRISKFDRQQTAKERRTGGKSNKGGGK